MLITMEVAGIIITVALGIVFNIVGVIGCIVPVLPGPLLSFISLILISIPAAFDLFSPLWLVVLGVISIASLIVDNILPVLSSKRAGASKAGIIGSIIGLVAGMIFFPPFGAIIGAFVGALGGELIFNRESEHPLKAALGVFTGTVMGIFMKLVISGVILIYFIIGCVRLIGS